ncbi:MAG: putative baseplate assembly protein, partial [Burkholderiales bacterium]
MYALRLVNVAGLDPRLSSVRFSFKVHCPTDFDCKPVDTCPPAVFRNPDIDYLARDYASFRHLMLDRLSALAPEWHERSPADLGITLVEILAYAADHLSYFLDGVGTESYLGSARRRISVRRHARLRDYFMHEGANARTFVALEVDEDSSPTTLPRRAQLLTRFGSDQTVVPPDLLSDALTAGAVVFETLDDVTLHAAHNRIPVYTWSDARCCLPAGATAVTLRGPLPNLLVGDLLLFEEMRGARTGAAADADPNRRHVVRLTRVEPGEDPLNGTPVVEIEWHEADALPFPLRLSSIDDEGNAIEDVSVARGNVALADHGRARRDDALVFSRGADVPLTLAGVPLTHAVALPDNHRDLPAVELRQVGPHHAVPQIRLVAGDEPWEVRRDLLGSRTSDRHFVAEMEEDGRARLRFGDNEHGMRPETGTGFSAE